MTDVEKPDYEVRPVRLLHGHTSPETAYVVDSYPYSRSRRLRCKIRYWIETKADGDQRFVYQTTNPTKPGEVWNNPKRSTYVLMAFMYLDRNDHVQWTGVNVWRPSPEQHDRYRLSGLLDQMTEEERKKYDVLLKISQKADSVGWQRWSELVEAVKAYRDSHGALPEVTNGVVTLDDGKPRYVGQENWPVLVALLNA